MHTYHAIKVTYIKSNLLELKSLSYKNDEPIKVLINLNEHIDEQIINFLKSKGFTCKAKSYIDIGLFVILVKEFKPLE